MSTLLAVIAGVLINVVTSGWTWPLGVGLMVLVGGWTGFEVWRAGQIHGDGGPGDRAGQAPRPASSPAVTASAAGDVPQPRPAALRSRRLILCGRIDSRSCRATRRRSPGRSAESSISPPAERTEHVGAENCRLGGDGFGSSDRRTAYFRIERRQRWAPLVFARSRGRAAIKDGRDRASRCNQSGNAVG
jgi:hypothetical protein